MLCPKCRREELDNEMEIRGTQWYCKRHHLYVDFPITPPSYDELLKQVEFLKNENKELNRAVAHLTELLNLSEIEAASEFI